MRVPWVLHGHVIRIRGMSITSNIGKIGMMVGIPDSMERVYMAEAPTLNLHLAGQPWLWEFPPKGWREKADMWFIRQGLFEIIELIIYIYGPESPNDAFDKIVANHVG